MLGEEMKEAEEEDEWSLERRGGNKDTEDAKKRCLRTQVKRRHSVRGRSRFKKRTNAWVRETRGC